MTFITDCAVCAGLPPGRILARGHGAERLAGLEVVASRSGSGDDGSAMDLVERCTVCGTWYHHDHSVDTEDAFVGGPRVDENLHRLLPERCKVLFALLERPDLLEVLREQEPRWLGHFHDLVAHADRLRDDLLPYVVAALTDPLVLAGDWDGLERLLLRHPDPRVALAALYDLAVITGELAPRGWPSFRDFRDFTPAVQAAVVALLATHAEAFDACLAATAARPEPAVRERAAHVAWLAALYRG